MVYSGSNDAWRIAREVNQSHPISPMDVAEKILSYKNRNLKGAAFVALLYLTFSRIHEILPYKYCATYRKDIKLELPGIKSKDFQEIFDSQGNRWVNISLRVQKTGRVPKKLLRDKNFSEEDYKKFISSKRLSLQEGFRIMPIFIAPNSVEEKLGFLIDEYIDSITPQNEIKKISFKDTELFTFSHKQGWKYCSKILGMNPHSIRHLRCSHLANKYRFSIRELQALGGWKSPHQSLTYVKSDMQDVKNRMLTYENEIRNEM